jgi:hypothetical protein
LIDIAMVFVAIAVVVYFTKQTECDACCGRVKEETVGHRRRESSAREADERRLRMESKEVTSFVNPSLGVDARNVVPQLSIEMTPRTSERANGSAGEREGGGEVTDGEEGEEGEGGGEVTVTLGINPMHTIHGEAATTAASIAPETASETASELSRQMLLELHQRLATRIPRTFRKGKTQQRAKRLSPNHFAKRNASSSKVMRARQNESGGGGGNSMGEEVKTVLDVDVGGEEVIVIPGVNPMHAARGEATPTAPETATPTAARARWNKLKQVTETSRTFRNGGKQQRMKRLSKGTNARQHASAAGGGGGGGGGGNSIGVKTVLNVEAAVSIHVDEVSGRRYSYNKVTGHTQWLSDEDEGDEATVEEQGESTNKIRIAAFDYVAAESGELDMKVGDKIELLGAIDDDDDWGKGKNLRTGNVGDFPVGYLEFNL